MAREEASDVSKVAAPRPSTGPAAAKNQPRLLGTGSYLTVPCSYKYRAVVTRRPLDWLLSC